MKGHKDMIVCLGMVWFIIWFMHIQYIFLHIGIRNTFIGFIIATHKQDKPIVQTIHNIQICLLKSDLFYK